MNNRSDKSAGFAQQWAPVWIIMAAVAAWGIYHIIGAVRSGQDVGTGLAKALIIFASLSFFLGLWALALWTRARRDKREK